jgi:hypothetical protein
MMKENDKSDDQARVDHDKCQPCQLDRREESEYGIGEHGPGTPFDGVQKMSQPEERNDKRKRGCCELEEEIPLTACLAERSDILSDHG